MTTIICATNRKKARSRIVHKKLVELYQSAQPGEEVHTLDLLDVNFTLHSEQYKSSRQSEELGELQDQVLIPSDRLIFVIPEYNGSFAGIAKYFLDAISIRKYKETFKGKKALLVGCAEGRAGNLRGLDQFSQILMHMGVYVYPKKLPISKVDKLIEGGELTDEKTIQALDDRVRDFLLF